MGSDGRVQQAPGSGGSTHRSGERRSRASGPAPVPAFFFGPCYALRQTDMQHRPAFLAAALASAAALAAWQAPELLKLDGDAGGVHDPVIARQGEWYYCFATGGSVRRSKDLHHWSLAGRVFERLPEWATTEIAGARGGYWAPDISLYKGTYRLYYAVSTFGKNDSAIGLATNRTLDPESPDYRWVDQGMVFRSHREDDFNAIDPNLAVDENGGHWLNFGSFWGGIKMRRIDPETGKLSTGDTELYSLAARPRTGSPPSPDAIEAPFIVRHGGFYYLFVSFDFCCRGVKSTYNVVVGRARAITGRMWMPEVNPCWKAVEHGSSRELLSGAGPVTKRCCFSPAAPT